MRSPLSSGVGRLHGLTLTFLLAIRSLVRTLLRSPWAHPRAALRIGAAAAVHLGAARALAAQPLAAALASGARLRSDVAAPALARDTTPRALALLAPADSTAPGCGAKRLRGALGGAAVGVLGAWVGERVARAAFAGSPDARARRERNRAMLAFGVGGATVGAVRTRCTAR
jgi:hypothetical protein